MGIRETNKVGARETVAEECDEQYVSNISGYFTA